MWQHVQYVIDEQINELMEKQYQKLKKKMDTLAHKTSEIQRIKDKNKFKIPTKNNQHE